MASKNASYFFFFFKARCMLSALEMKEEQLWSLGVSYGFHWESTSEGLTIVIKVSQIVRKPKMSLVFFFRSQLFPWRALWITSLPPSSHILEGTCSQLTSRPTSIKCWRTSLVVTPWQAVQARIWMGWDRVGWGVVLWNICCVTSSGESPILAFLLLLMLEKREFSLETRPSKGMKAWVFPFYVISTFLTFKSNILLWPSVSRNLLKYLLLWGAGRRYLMFGRVWLFIWWYWLAKHHLTRNKIESPNSFGWQQETLLFYTFSFHFSNQYYFNFNKRTQSKEWKTKSLNVLCFLNKQKNLFKLIYTNTHTHTYTQPYFSKP